jgi:hypothetical protein
MTNLACFLGFFEDFPDFAVLDDFDGGIMKLVEIDMIRLKPFKVSLEHAADVVRNKVSLAALRSSHHISTLGSEDDFVAPPLNALPSKVSE